MKVGLSYWSFLSDIEPDTPSGSNFHVPDLVIEMNRRGWDVVALQENRDKILADKLKVKIPFGENFIPLKRKKCYDSLFKIEEHPGLAIKSNKYYKDYYKDACSSNPHGLPIVDLLIVEWRWPIPGRNTFEDTNSPGFTPDLARQNLLLDYYHNYTDTTIVILDLDHKMTEDDEKKYNKAHIFEMSVSPKSVLTQRVRAFLPFDIDEVYKHKVYLKDPANKVTYIGNHYERDWAIDTFIKPLSEILPENSIRFVGNWEKYPDVFKEVKARWPRLSYEPRVVKEDFLFKYSPALTCPLLGKESYYESGFMSPRLVESLMYGCLPVGFKIHKGIEYFLPSELIVEDHREYKHLLERLEKMSINEYNSLLYKVYPFLDLYSPKDYVNKLDDCIGELPKKVKCY